MLTLRDAFEFAQADCPNFVDKIFPRLRQLARNGQVSEEVFLAVTHAADRRRLSHNSATTTAQKFGLRPRPKHYPTAVCSVCSSEFEQHYPLQKTCGADLCRRTHRLRRMHAYDVERRAA